MKPDARSSSLRDRRLTPARPDLAAASLRGKVEAARFVEGRRRVVIEAAAPLRRAPAHDAPLETEALFGESVTVYEEHEGWAWGQLQRDSYVGYMPANALGPETAPTHRLAATRSFLYPQPNIQASPMTALPLGALVSVSSIEGDFSALATGGFIYSRHLAALDDFEPDFVAVAERFLEAPYLWGGRTSQGLDCSALIQIALAAAGRAAPRDSDLQEAALGSPVAFDDSLAGLKRGDLVFWQRHVAVMRDEAVLVHANGWHMKVAAEQLRAARDRIASKNGGPITSIRRF
jgi:cell wall-associated NlpC family hydrolase